MYGHPNSALSYTCENLWHYVLGLERLKKSHEICSAESRSVNVRQGCCFCSSTFYFKAAPELQSLILFHNIEKEGQIWSVRCAVLSVEFVTETVIAGCHGSVCAARKTCSVGFWFLAAFKPLVTIQPSSSTAWSPLGKSQGHLLAGLAAMVSSTLGYLGGPWSCTRASARQQKMFLLSQENCV